MEAPTVTKRRMRRYSSEQKAAYIKQWRESGKSQRVFCIEQGLNYKSLSNWIMRINKLSARKSSGFVAVKVKRVINNPGGLFAAVKTAEGVVISLYTEVPAEYLRNIAQR
jgi:hypothetical protein